MCGFIGVFGPDGSHAAPEIYEGLLAIQHRGQDAAGITTFTDSFHVKKGRGLVIEVFKAKNMARLQGNLGLGHVRYPTVGGGRNEDAQPFHHTYPLGVAMAHNGNVTNLAELTEKRFSNHGTRLDSTCDLEVLLWVFQDALARRMSAGHAIDAEDVFDAVGQVFEEVKGAYSVVATIADRGLVAFRDPYGIKPICLGSKTTDQGVSYACASESVVLEVNGYHRVRDLAPGEALFIDQERKVHYRKLADSPHRPCIFELVYFARPDSFLDDISVYRTRRRFGKALAEQWRARGGPIPDVVIPVPDSSRDAAMGFAEVLGLRYREGLVKNRYIGRTFIMPDHASRDSSVRRKLNPIPLEFKDKEVLLIDDSIVRGNTSRRIVSMAREVGAKKVYFGVTSPPLVAPCPYGIDMASKREFIATDRNADEIARWLGVDHLMYLDREAMNEAARQGNPEVQGFCNGCFTGEYPTQDVTLERLQRIEAERSKHGERTAAR